MNEQLQQFARRTLKEGLAQLPPSWQNMFKLMYRRQNGTRSVELTQQIPLEEIIDNMPYDKLDWAMTQVSNSLKKQNNTKHEN